MTTTPKIIDCFPYNGELITPFRIRYLYDVVDIFVIVEARDTHSGTRKDTLYFEQNREQFAPFMDKIAYIPIDEFPATPSAEWLQQFATQYTFIRPDSRDSWWREMYQRDVGERYVRTAHPYITFVCDADEVPRRDVVQHARSLYAECAAQPVFLEMEFFYYNFNWKKKSNWYHAFVVTDQTPVVSWNHVRIGQPRERLIRSAGWHCSYFADRAGIRRKLQSFAHRECDRDEFKTDAFLDDCLQRGRDIADRGQDEDLQLSSAPPPPSIDNIWAELQQQLIAHQI